MDAVDHGSCGRRLSSTQPARATGNPNPTDPIMDLSPAVAEAVAAEPSGGDSREGSSGRGDGDDIDITAMRCTLRDVPGTEADVLADTLISLGAQSAR